MSKVGITYNPSVDLLSSGHNQTAILLCELFRELGGYNITLINIKNTEDEWWSDFPKYDTINLSSLNKSMDLDLLIDIDASINDIFRKKLAKKSIVFLRTFLQFDEMDRSVYPELSKNTRNFVNISEIWCWDILNPENTIPSIQTLFSCPIRRVPFIWSSTVATHYSKNTIGYTPNSKWTVHISEKNNTNSSSSVLPLVAIREMYLKNVIDAQYKCHNMEMILENKFLKENVLHNIEVSKLPLEFVKSEIITNWGNNHILFSHSRFTPLRIGLLNALWLGIPVIHNSPIIKELHPILDNLSYFGNEITGICKAFNNFTLIPESYYHVHNEIKANILHNWGIQNNVDKWKGVLQDMVISKHDMTNNIDGKRDAEGVREVKQEIILAFSDFWPGFNYDDNFFTNMIRNECINREITVKGVKYMNGIKANIVFCGPFSSEWKNIHGVPKVFTTSENWNVPNDDSISLYLTPYRYEDETHMRLPTWMTFIDWYSESDSLTSVNTDNNPNLLPYKLAMTVHPKPFSTRDEFCGFVVSNPISQFRNETFFVLNSYKKVNSGGELFNNIGGRLELKYPGGGCGDIPKLKFFENHKFTLSFENSQAPGYITEKVLHSKMAGCLPIYWGDIDTDSDFVPGSFINISASHNSDDVVTIIKKLEENPEMCEKIASTPILNEEKKQKALYTLSKIAKRILKIALNDTQKNDVIQTNPSTKINGIDKIYVINLDKRQDRLSTLLDTEPYLKDVVERIPGVDGNTLKLNNFIYKLFENNIFGWKKSIIGCYLSHITAWSKIASGLGNMTLILEDDVRFNKDWINVWNKSLSSMPDDAELIYLGGVLPPNKVGLPLCLEKINEYWSYIKPNTFFTPYPSPTFHFCAYSYILTKKGAQKLLYYLTTQNKVLFNGCDHLIGCSEVGLKKYIINPLLSYCFQEDDPVYVNSQFNDINRKDVFDSDIWNNTDCFTEDEIKEVLNNDKPITIYCMDDYNTSELYEIKWLKEIIKSKINFKQIKDMRQLVEDNSWFLVQKPHIEKFGHYFSYLKENNVNFKVFHISDEYINDSVEFYNYPNCKCVIRNYFRNDISSYPHIVTIPLGYHHKNTVNNKSFVDRKYVWSFHGTNWFNRQELLSNILNITPNVCHLTDTWNDPNQSKEYHYLDTLANSKFCPILRGNNFETFRLYESLEVGTIPIYVRSQGDELFWQFISKLGLINIDNWVIAKEIIDRFINNPSDAENYRNTILNNWIQWKKEITNFIGKMK
jgi:alpha(1,3/1,4) fucosyltransferase